MIRSIESHGVRRARTTIRRAALVLASSLATTAPLAAQTCPAPPTNDPFMVRYTSPLGQCVEKAPTEYQWGVYRLNLPAAWVRQPGHAYVSIIDLGLETAHPEFQGVPAAGSSVGNYRPQFSADLRGSTHWLHIDDAPLMAAHILSEDDRDPDEFEFIDYVPPYDGAPDTRVGPVPAPRQDFAGHGTHVAGILGATTGNGAGVAGACQHCSVAVTHGVGVLSGGTAQGLQWAIDRGSQVINGSWASDRGAPTSICGPGGSSNDAVLEFCAALDRAVERDLVLVFAAGNALTGVEYPARDPRFIGVGGLEADGSVWRRNDDPGEACPTAGSNAECGSNFGPELDLIAPAENILSTAYTGKQWILASEPGGPCGDTSVIDGYGLCTGTSMAAPFVSGVVALVRSTNPLLARNAVYDILTQTADRAQARDDLHGYGVPDAGLAVERALGRAGGQVLSNRLTPLFSLYSETAGDWLYTTVPQVASAALDGQLQEGCTDRLRLACASAATPYVTSGPSVPQYASFPGFRCTVSPCNPLMPRASVYVFTSDAAPFAGAPPLVPLYRLSFKGASNSNPSLANRDHTYTTEVAGLRLFQSGPAPYALDGIEGYIYQRCTPEPTCIPSRAVKLLRRYNAARDDFAIFPESELAAMVAQGYTSTGGAQFNEILGYVYPNLDGDGDGLIDGFEGLAGTNPALADTDLDGLSDGVELLQYPYSDPLVFPKAVQWLAQSVPTTMLTGQTYPVSLRLQNVGTLTWGLIGPQCNAYRVGSANPRDNVMWGVGRVELPATFAPGQARDVNFTVRAPSTSGLYNFQWQMVHECVEWFGSPSPNAVVTVQNPAPVARFTFSCSGLACAFDASSSTDNLGIASYAWTFGDGGTGVGVTSNRTYATTNAFVVTLTVTDGEGKTASTSRRVSVNGEAAQPAQRYFALTPCRVLDTRTTTILTSGQLRALPIAGQCGVPASAKAVSLNVTAIAPNGAGFISFYPGNQTSSPFEHSTLNFTPVSAPRANNAIVRLATDGSGGLNLLPIVAAAPGQVHATVDVYGYFSTDTTPAAGSVGPLGFQGVMPCRALDTRNSSAVSVGSTRDFTIQGVCGVPVGAAAAALNSAILAPSAGGHATVFQAGFAPPVPTENFPAGVTLANGTRTRLAAATPDASFLYYTPTAGASTHVLVDVYGYFKTTAPWVYRPLSTCRAVDTRLADQGAPALVAGQTRAFQIRGNCGVPSSAKAVAVNITSTDSTGPGFLAAYSAGSSLPAASYLNFVNGDTFANGGIVMLSAAGEDLAIAASTGTQVIVDVYGYFE